MNWMDDLISRAAAIEHMKSMAGCATCNNYNGVRCRACEWNDAMDIVDEVPAVDAVPVEWLKKKRDSETLTLFSNIYGRGDKDIVHSIHKVLELWRKEQEKQNG